MASPIEQEINGVDDMIYMVTQSTGDGAMQIDCGLQARHQHRSGPGAGAEPRLDRDTAVCREEVQRIGVTVKKKSPDLMMVIHLISPDGSLDQSYISNYATINIKDVLTRVDGVGDTIVFGARDYSMRVWLDPAKVQSRGLTAERCGHGAARRQRAGCRAAPSTSRRRNRPAASRSRCRRSAG